MRIPVFIVAAFFIFGGIAHFVLADFFVAIMPSYLPWHEELVAISGVFEIVLALALLWPKTRLLAAWGLIALAIAVFPANINMAMHPEQFPEMSKEFLYGRLPLQAVIIGFIYYAVAPERKARKPA